MLERAFILLSDAVDSVVTLLRILVRSKYLTSVGRADNTKCIILANGPSLTAQIRGRTFDEYDLYCVNGFPLTEDFQRLKPGNLIIVGPEFFVKDVEHPSYEIFKRCLDAVRDEVTWTMNFYIPFGSRRSSLIKSVAVNKKINIVYFNTTAVEGFTSMNGFLFGSRLGMPRPHNVLIPSIMIAMWNGSKEISLMGVDHSWLPEISVNQNNEALLNQKHFYDKGKSVSKPMYGVHGRQERRLHEILYKFYLSFKGYHTIRRWADKKGVSIYNLTKGSFIDAFERRDMEELSKINS